MKNLSILICTLLCIVDLNSCETANFAPPPPVTSQMASVGRAQHVGVATLREGRALFVSRCIDCHTLPVVSRYGAAEWPQLVDKMSRRADLKRSERDAIVAYILAARAQL